MILNICKWIIYQTPINVKINLFIHKDCRRYISQSVPNILGESNNIKSFLLIFLFLPSVNLFSLCTTCKPESAIIKMIAMQYGYLLSFKICF